MPWPSYGFPVQQVFIGHPSYPGSYYYTRSGSFNLQLIKPVTRRRTITGQLDQQTIGIIGKEWEFVIATTSVDNFEFLMNALLQKVPNNKFLLIDRFGTSYEAYLEPAGVITERFDDFE